MPFYLDHRAVDLTICFSAAEFPFWKWRLWTTPSRMLYHSQREHANETSANSEVDSLRLIFASSLTLLYYTTKNKLDYCFPHSV